MFLEDGEWNSANEYCEKVLDIEPKCAKAYLGKMMADLKIGTEDALKDSKTFLEKNCVNVVMTRTGVGGLYGFLSKGFKRRDMQKRKEIINSSQGDLMVSIHINKCPFPYRKGLPPQ